MKLTTDDCRLILDHLDLAQIVAWEFAGKARYDDLEASANYGLCKAAAARPRPANFRTFAWSACARQIIDDLRKWERRNIGVCPVIPLDVDLESDGASPCDVASDHEDLERLERALGRIPPHRAAIFRMRIDGMSVSAIAVVRQRSVCTTRFHLDAAIHALAGHLTCTK